MIHGKFAGIIKAITKPNGYPLRHIHNLNYALYRKRIFSKLDFKRAYFQIAVEPSDISKTSKITQVGLHEFFYMLYELFNSGKSFQRFIDYTLRSTNCFPYLDGVLIAPTNFGAYLKDFG